MEWFLSHTIVFLSFIFFIKEGLCQVSGGGGGIMCYVCNSQTDPRCGHPFQPHQFTPLNCSNLSYMDDHGQKLMASENKTAPTLCRKNYQTVTLGGRTDTRIVRNCGFLSKNKPMYGVEPDEDEGLEGEERCFRKAGTFEVMVTYCTCTTNICNGSHNFGPYFLLIFPIVGILSLLNLPSTIESILTINNY